MSTSATITLQNQIDNYESRIREIDYEIDLAKLTIEKQNSIRKNYVTGIVELKAALEKLA